jgi:ABC-2 type transport system permease protein
MRIDPAVFIDPSLFEPPAEPELVYVHGSEDMQTFDFYGPVFIGVFVFFFVFITAGISFVRERTGGTLERVMATPLRRWEVVLGYILGYLLFAAAQTVIVAWASIYWVGFPNLGEFWLVVLVAVSMAIASLTLGVLVSEFANTELQVMQLMQIVVIPQILLSGMFDLSQTPQWMQALSRAFPLTYGADAMRDVMLRGAGFGGVVADLGVLWAFIAGFFVLNVLALKKYRRI